MWSFKPSLEGGSRRETKFPKEWSSLYCTACSPPRQLRQLQQLRQLGVWILKGPRTVQPLRNIRPTPEISHAGWAPEPGRWLLGVKQGRLQMKHLEGPCEISGFWLKLGICGWTCVPCCSYPLKELLLNFVLPRSRVWLCLDTTKRP